MNEFESFSLSEWLSYLESRHTQEIQLGLTRIRTVAERLHLNKLNARVITVAGTNGKGSTVTMLESIYRAAGYNVATYTSPHLLIFNERIRVNLQPISDVDLCDAFKYLEHERGSVSLTYFEMATLAAFYYFKKFELDIIILEVGLGGRLDATNIIDADVSIITTIDYDHQDFLGGTLNEIGIEKAGILRANRPFIYADDNPPESVVTAAIRLNTSMHLFNRDYHVSVKDNEFLISYHKDKIMHLPIPRMNAKAAAGAFMATLCLQDELPVSDEHICCGFRTAFISGRQQLVEGDVSTVYDVGHNPQAVKLLAEFIQTQCHEDRKIHAVFSALKDKDLCGLIRPMSDLVDVWYPALLTGNRATSEESLLKAFHDVLNYRPVCFENALKAYGMAFIEAKPGDLIVVYGSFLTVSTVLSASAPYSKQEKV